METPTTTSPDQHAVSAPEKLPVRSLRWWARRLPFIGIMLMPVGVFWTGITVRDLVLCAVLYFVRMFFVTAGYHRYFSHRAFKTNRFVQFLLAFGAQTSAQRGALWWAAHHRLHHRYSDTELDPHSPLHGFWHSHILWITDPHNRRTRTEHIRDFSKYWELRFLNRWHALPAWILGAACFLLGGPGALFVGFFLSTFLLYHGTFTINSLSHVFGSRRFVTSDTSRNNFLLAFITCGEGWHNNHHHYPSAARQGFVWWEIDATYYVLKALSWVGLVKDLRQPTAEAKAKNLIEDGHPDIGLFRAHWKKASSALANRRAQTGAYYGARKRAVEDLVETTVATAEEIARMPRVPAASRGS